VGFFIFDLMGIGRGLKGKEGQGHEKDHIDIVGYGDVGGM
jgi:hypothetical protein